MNTNTYAIAYINGNFENQTRNMKAYLANKGNGATEYSSLYNNVNCKKFLR